MSITLLIMATSHTYLCVICKSRATFYCECTNPTTTLCVAHIGTHSIEKGKHEPKRIYMQCTEEEQKAAHDCMSSVSYTIKQRMSKILEDRNRKMQKLLEGMKKLDMDY